MQIETDPMREKSQHVCPIELAGSLDNRARRWLQNPLKILAPYINPGMTILDIGCGPGFFTLEMARLVGPDGNVVAADLQQGMLKKIRQKITGTTLNDLITLHRCKEDEIGLSASFDFILAFYMVHEVPDQKKFLEELYSLLKPGGSLLIIEPRFHVTERSFEKTIETLSQCGFTIIRQKSFMINREVLATRNNLA